MDNSKRPPVMSDEARESRLISLAMDVAEEQLLNRTASAQVITHYLKLGAIREQLEVEKVKAETELAKAKVKALESAETTEQMYREAIAAMASYTRHSAFDKGDDEDD